jgi:hypothetical protein
LAARTAEAKLLLEQYEKEEKFLDFSSQRNLLRQALAHLKGSPVEGEIRRPLESGAGLKSGAVT